MTDQPPPTNKTPAQIQATNYDNLNRLSQEVVALFMHRVTDAMTRSGTSEIGLDGLQQIADRMSGGKDPALPKIYERNWERLQQTFEQAFYARMRKFPLERLIVANFEHLLTKRGDPPERGKTLSRRVIPATIGALHQMVGPDLFKEYEERAHQLVEAVRTLEGDGSAWDKLYHHPQAQILVNDILIYIARYFTDIAKRRQWMIGFMERNLPAPKNDNEKDWVFDDDAFHLLVGGLYTNLGRQLADPAQRARHVKRYGEENVAMVENLRAGLEKDRRAVLGR